MLLALPCIAHVMRRFRPVEALVIGLGRGEARIVDWGGGLPHLSGWQWSARRLRRSAAPNNESTSRAAAAAVVMVGRRKGGGGGHLERNGRCHELLCAFRAHEAGYLPRGGAHASGYQREPDQGFVPGVCGSLGSPRTSARVSMPSLYSFFPPKFFSGPSLQLHLLRYDARAARALCGGEVRAERAPRDCGAHEAL